LDGGNGEGWHVGIFIILIYENIMRLQQLF